MEARGWLSLAAGGLAVVLVSLAPRPAQGFGDLGAFDPRVFLAGGQTGPARPMAAPRWSWELERRTSAPVRQKPLTVHADEPSLTDEPFVYWSGDAAPGPLTPGEVAGLRRFFSLGGVMLVDDAAPGDNGSIGAFGRTARAEIARVLPDAAPIAIGTEHVIFRSFYLLRRAEGRVMGPRTLDAVVRGGKTQVVFSDHDLGGALARGPSGAWEVPVVPGGPDQREHAIRLAVNIAMYVLCSNYKDDQVHAPFLMRKRAMLPEP
jgi:hypothetical protein